MSKSKVSIAELEKRANALEARALRLRELIASRHKRCPNCGEAYHKNSKMADAKSYSGGWLCPGVRLGH